jgi:aspartyl-tRNA(Asn)/glutamyl-tRNA(Gln) amidotransferase subunit B
MPLSDYEIILGFEVHAQLKTRTKIFCSCPVEFGEEPNTNVCPVCLGLPGVLPVLNDQVVKLAIRAGLALGCTIALRSRFARKHYFYPDLPKGYQITQYTEPLAENGFLRIVARSEPFVAQTKNQEPRTKNQERRIRVRRCHIEEDAGKSIHAGESSLVDFNRCGVPLIEIVTEPDLRSSDEGIAYLTSLRQILRYLDVSDADMEKGHFRCEVNVSVRPRGSREFRTQSEIKNLNSLRAVRDAIEYEAKRQTELYDRGEPVLKETLLWDEKNACTAPMRGKETAEDYRYFPEPDLPPLVVTPEEIETIRASLPELPDARKRRYVTTLGLSEDEATRVVGASREDADYFEEVNVNMVDRDPKLVANWLTSGTTEYIEARQIPSSRVKATALAELLSMLKQNRITRKTAKEVFAEMAEKGGSPQAIVQAKGLALVADEAILTQMVDEVIATETALVEKYKSGKTNVLEALVGAVMRKSRGKFPPAQVRELFARKLS